MGTSKALGTLHTTEAKPSEDPGLWPVDSGQESQTGLVIAGPAGCSQARGSSRGFQRVPAKELMKEHEDFEGSPKLASSLKPVCSPEKQGVCSLT